VHVPPLAFFEEQLDTTLRDIGADAIKTGMLPSQEQVTTPISGKEVVY
jgi:hydroxymethylpyrimidine/phosphomethylpyrimidine kinase